MSKKKLFYILLAFLFSFSIVTAAEFLACPEVSDRSDCFVNDVVNGQVIPRMYKYDTTSGVLSPLLAPTQINSEALTLSNINFNDLVKKESTPTLFLPVLPSGARKGITILTYATLEALQEKVEQSSGEEKTKAQQELDEAIEEARKEVSVSAPSTSQVQKGTVGAKVEGATVYEGCRNKRFGLVGASNTVDEWEGKPLDPARRNVNIIQEFCPGATVFLKAVGGANPEAQASLLEQVLANDNLDYVIIDPSANGQGDFSGWDSERYTAAAIKLAEMVKEKDSDTEVIMLTNTPTKGAAGGYGTPTAVQRIKDFNADLLDYHLGREDLIDYPVDTYSAIESSPGSDTCGYCGNDKGGLGDGIHFGPTGRKRVMKAVMDKVFGAPTTETVVTNTAVSSTSSTMAENCLDKNRCDEIDKVWLFIVKWINSARNGHIFDTVKGSFRPYQEARPTVVVTPGVPTPTVSVTGIEPLAMNGGDPYLRAFMRMITKYEAASKICNGISPYQTLVGGTMKSDPQGRYGGKLSGGCFGNYFNGFNGHPNIAVEWREGSKTSDAAGRYQFLESSWQSKYAPLTSKGVNDFSPQNQDETVHNWLKNKGIDQILRSAGPNPDPNSESFKDTWQTIMEAKRIGKEWASLPYGCYDNQGCHLRESKTFRESAQVYVLLLREELGISSPGIPSPSFPSTGGATLSACPPEMANIDNKYCIDKWEATVVDKNTEAEASPHYIPLRTGPITADYQYNQFVNRETTPAGYPMPERGAEANANFVAMAVSVPGKIPASFVTREAAKQACNQNAGKRLCTQQEWYKSCAGPDGPSFLQAAYPYGSTYQGGKCNVAIASPWPPSVIGRTSNGNDMMDPRIGTVEGTNGQLMKQPTGAFSECSNSYGVFDMVGNVHEIVADTAPGSQCSGGQCAVFVGSHYARPGQGQTPESQGCQEDTTAHDQVGYTDYSVGFRCCATLSAIN